MGISLLSAVGQSLLQNTASHIQPPVDRGVGEGSAGDAAATQSAAAILDVSDRPVARLGYSQRLEQISIAALLEQVRARFGSADAPSASTVQAEQLLFQFELDARAEDLRVFSQRANALAEGLDGPRQSSFLASSRSIAVRFSLSLEVSSSALQGFASAAEDAARGTDETFDRFEQFVDDLLTYSNEVFSRALELLNQFWSSEDDLSARMGNLIAGLQDLGLYDGLLPALGSGSGGASSARFTSASFSLSVQLEFEFTMEEAVQESDPVTLDLDGDGVELTSYRNGALFDILGNGRAARTAFVTGGDAFLALDRNGNGVIDSGTELFGDQNGAKNGFEELRKLDSNGDGRIDSLDRDYSRLLVWRDNGNGLTEPGELQTLTDAGIAEIDLAYREVDLAAAGGNRIAQAATFSRLDGSRGEAVDSVLNYLA